MYRRSLAREGPGSVSFGKEVQLSTEFERMVEFLDQAWVLKDQIVPCLIGPVGIGKTAAVLKHADNVGAKHVVTIIASQILPSEVSGITMPDKDTKSMEIYDHYRLSSLEDGDILFFDELLEADQSVLSACLTLIESRQMMSGKKLPNIQIVAATNPTVDPSLLRENIRQRFMFMRFRIDQKGTHDYIKEKTGLDLDNSILGMLKETDSSYNILSPRSLTKLCEWTAAVEDPDQLAPLINNMWGNCLGTQLARFARASRRKSPRQELAEKIHELKPDLDFDFEECTMQELMNLLKQDPDWTSIMMELSSTELSSMDESAMKVDY